MSSNQSYSPSGRRPRRGGQRSGNRGPRRRGPNTSASKPAPKKKSFWQSIIAFFTGNSEKPASSTVQRPERSSERPPRQETPREERPAARKPEPIDVTSPRVYVGNLSFDATESDLFELFSGVGSVQNVEIVASKHTQRSKGFGFISLQSIDEAKRAVDDLHDKEFMGRKLVVSGAKALDERRSERNRQPEQ